MFTLDQPFGARRISEGGNGAERFTWAPEGGSPRVRSARSEAIESASAVYAATADDGIRYYSRRERKGISGARFPGVRSRPWLAGTFATMRTHGV